MADHPRVLPIALVSSDTRVLEIEVPATVRALTPGRAEVVARCGTSVFSAMVDVSNPDAAAGGR